MDLPRRALVDALAHRAQDGETLLLTGPAGIGKSWLLRALRGVLQDRRVPVVHLDLLLAVASPERFVAAASRALGSDSPLGGVDAILQAWATAAGGGVLLLDEIAEMRALATFPGLRDVEQRFADALRTRRGAVLSTAYPTAAARLPHLQRMEVPPLSAADLGAVAGGRGDGLARLSAGWPLYAEALLPHLDADASLVGAWADAMAPGGALDAACRRVYETLLLRSRGYAMSKAVLEAVALEEGLNLTALVSRLGRTPGAVRDYLGWLLDVQALRAERKRYFMVDPVLRDWLRLNAGGRLPDEGARAEAARERLGDADDRPAPLRARHDALMEID